MFEFSEFILDNQRKITAVESLDDPNEVIICWDWSAFIISQLKREL